MALAKRYQRNVQALSERECRVLQDRRVVVVGCGGLGCSVVEALARIGVGWLFLVDDDVFEETNLNRQLFATVETLGRPKVEVATERVAVVNPDVRVEARRMLLSEDNARELVRGADCAVDCLDTREARFWLAHACQAEHIPLVYGGIAGWYGQVCTVYPGDLSFSVVYGSTEGTSVHLQEGNLPFTAAAVASFQAAEAVKVMLGREGVLRNRLLMVDMLGGSVEELDLA